MIRRGRAIKHLPVFGCTPQKKDKGKGESELPRNAVLPAAF